MIITNSNITTTTTTTTTTNNDNDDNTATTNNIFTGPVGNGGRVSALGSRANEHQGKTNIASLVAVRIQIL